MRTHRRLTPRTHRDQALLDKYGLKNNDAILAEKQHLGLYDELMTKDAKLIPGGAAQNTARGVQVRQSPLYFLLSVPIPNIPSLQYILSPDSVIYFGCVGKDKYSETLEKANKEAGLTTKYLYDSNEPTGRCGVVITGHDRSMCTDLAAANCYKVEHLKENWEIVEKSKAYFVGGYHLTVSVPAIMALAEEAASKNKVR